MYILYITINIYQMRIEKIMLVPQSPDVSSKQQGGDNNQFNQPLLKTNSFLL